MARADYVIFWADGHHPVRILPIRLSEEDQALGSHAARKLNLYCEYLKAVFPGSCIQWEPSNDKKGSHAGQLASDMQEYLAWQEERS